MSHLSSEIFPAHTTILTFVFKPPRDDEHPSSAQAGWTRSDSPHKIRVVVVDDEPAIAETLVEILRGEGYDALLASTGEDAVNLATEFKPDIVISDVVLPRVNGIEAGIRIRGILPECRVILFSGQAATLHLLKNARTQGHEFEVLAKPIKPQALLDIIRRQPR